MYSVNNTIEIISGTGPYNETLASIRNNTDLRCNGETIQGQNTGRGLTIWKNSYLEINNCTFKNFDTGIYIYGTAQAQPTSNVINHSTFIGNNEKAIWIDTYSQNNTIINNNISLNNDYGIYFGTSKTINNNVTCNNFHNNTDYAIYFANKAENNTVYKNNDKQ